MITFNIQQYIAKALLCCGIAATLGTVTSCKEDIDESNL